MAGDHFFKRQLERVSHKSTVENEIDYDPTRIVHTIFRKEIFLEWSE
jgi:hypothetical protein